MITVRSILNKISEVELAIVATQPSFHILYQPIWIFLASLALDPCLSSSLAQDNLSQTTQIPGHLKISLNDSCWTLPFFSLMLVMILLPYYH